MIKKICAIAGLLAVTACVSPYVATPYDRGTASVTRIAIADDSVPERLSAWEVASAGSNFGLIGALADAGIQHDRENDMMEALAGVEFDAEATLETRVAETLTAQGYEATVLAGANPREKRLFLERYDGAA